MKNYQLIRLFRCAIHPLTKARGFPRFMVKKGYTSQSKNLNTIDCLKNIYAHFPTGAAQKAAATASIPPALNSFEVEVIGIDGPELKIAKVLESFDYDVPGVVLAGKSRSHRIGDTIRVTKTDTGYALA